jgi:hypothetical protein
MSLKIADWAKSALLAHPQQHSPQQKEKPIIIIIFTHIWYKGMENEFGVN